MPDPQNIVFDCIVLGAGIAGVDDDPWPDGILFMRYGPYLQELGFGRGQMLIEIDGEPVQDIFYDRWITKRIKRPAGFHADHYRDLIEYLFDKKPGETIVIKMYLNVPTSHTEIGSYTPEVEYWQIVLD